MSQLRNGNTILDYDSFRNFLEDFYLRKREQNPYWSYTLWARKINLANGSSLHKIVKGQRNIGAKALEALVDYFEFNPIEERYFRLLVSKEKSLDDPDLLKAIEKEISDLLVELKVSIENDGSLGVPLRYYHFILRKMAQIEPIQYDLDKICDSFLFPVDKKEMKKAIEELLALGILTHTKENNLEYIGKNLTRYFGDRFEIWDERKAFRSQCIDASKYILSELEEEKVPYEPFYGSLTFNINEENIEEADKDLMDMYKKFCSKYSEASGPGTKVFQLQIQMFPLRKET